MGKKNESFSTEEFVRELRGYFDEESFAMRVVDLIEESSKNPIIIQDLGFMIEINKLEKKVRTEKKGALFYRSSHQHGIPYSYALNERYLSDKKDLWKTIDSFQNISQKSLFNRAITVMEQYPHALGFLLEINELGETINEFSNIMKTSDSSKDNVEPFYLLPTYDKKGLIDLVPFDSANEYTFIPFFSRK